jgi:hypothetical protein
MTDDSAVPEGQATDPAAPEKPRRRRDGRFMPGISGNPTGRPSNPRVGIAEARRLLNSKLPSLCERAITLAESGDFAALRLCLERGLPLVKDEPVAFQMAPINSLQDIDKALGDIVNFVASGDLTPNEANGVAQLLELKRRTIEMTLVDQRLNALEARGTQSNGHGDMNGYDNGHAP